MTIEKARRIIYKHMIDSTSLVAITTPVFSALEKLMGMSNEISIEARKLGVYATYGGFGYLAAGGRQLWRKFFHIDKNTKKGIQNLHDHMYFGAFSLATSPIFYYLSGANDLDILSGMGISTAMGLLFGGRMGYFIDCYEELMGIGETSRLPKMLQKQKPTVKKGMAVLLTAAAIGISAGIYALSENKD